MSFRSLFAALILASAVPGVHASVITVPPSVTPGSTYRLVFVTSTTTNGLSSNIADYNTFVTNVANSVPDLAALGVTWTAIVSTFSTSAASNIGGASSDPIYLLDGTLVANGTSDLFDGSIDAPIAITETGSTRSGFSVWTGSATDGSGYFPLNHPIPYTGNSGATDGSWIHWTEEGNSQSYSFYAISSELTAPSATATPEPASAALMFAGAALILLGRRRRVVSK